MNREEFKTISAQLKKVSKVRVRLAGLREDLPAEFAALVKDHGPSFVELGIKGHRGLKRFLFTQIQSVDFEVPENA